MVLMSSNREVEGQTKHTLQNLANLGAILLMKPVGLMSPSHAAERCRGPATRCANTQTVTSC
jgi:hypothetical protein